MVVSLSNAAAIAAVDAVTALINAGTTNAAGKVVIYAGTAPANADAALAGNTVLAQLDMSNPAFAGAIDANPNAVATANPISDDTAADATGTASFFRVLDRDDTPVYQGNIVASPATGDMVMNSVSIQINATVKINSATLTMPE